MNEEVLAALAKAKWNESVKVDIENDNGTNSMILVPRLDRHNGGVKWEDAASAAACGDRDPRYSNADAVETIAHIHTKKWIFPMLNDQRRNNLYQTAIERASKEAVRRFLVLENGNDRNCGSVLQTLDIGSGTGLLAMLSENHLSKALVANNNNNNRSTTGTTPSIEVTSLEMAGPMAALAKRTVELETKKKNCKDKNTNKNYNLPSVRAPASSTVNVIEGHSCKIRSMKSNSSSSSKSPGTMNPDRSSTGEEKREGDGACWLCTSELLESGLLGEGWLPAMRDAWERHLHPEAVVLPQRARVVAQLVEGVAGFCGPHRSLEMGTTTKPPPPQADGTTTSATTSTTEDDFTSVPPLRLFTTAAADSCIGMLSDGSYDPLTGGKHGIQVEIHADRYLGNNGDGDGNEGSGSKSDLWILSDPIVALSIDVTSPSSLPSPEHSRLPSSHTTFIAKESGRAEGILFWWELDLYGDDLTYSTQPGSDFQDHWHQCLYVFPFSNGGCGIQVKENTEYSLLASHTDSRVHFLVSSAEHETENGNNGNVTTTQSDPRESKRQKPTVPPQVSPVAGPRRCWQLNDVARSATFRDGILCALNTLAAPTSANTNTNTKPTIVLDVSDFSLCGMMASMLGAKNVTSLESSSSGLPLEAARVAQIGNSLPLGGTNKFQIVQCHAESLTKEIVRGCNDDNEDEEEEDGAAAAAVVDLVVGEPYYEMLEGWPIETALNYFYTIKMLKRNGIVKPKALCVPAHAIILACGIECSDLGTAYQKHLSQVSSSSSSVCGFDHSPVAECWNYDQHGISIPLWEYNNVVSVTEIVEVGRLDYETNQILEGNWMVGDSNNNNTNETATTTSFLMAPFTKENRTCHAIAFWVDYKIRNHTPRSLSREPSSSSSFETISTGFGDAAAAAADSDTSCSSSSSQIVERQTVRILVKELPTRLGESLVIPRHGLEL
jgi:protein arginine N-methyltransferase 7